MTHIIIAGQVDVISFATDHDSIGPQVRVLLQHAASRVA